MSDKESESVEIQGRPLHCQICEGKTFWKRKAQLSTAFATLMNLDWLDASAQCYVCEKCGYVHWFLPQKR